MVSKPRATTARPAAPPKPTTAGEALRDEALDQAVGGVGSRSTGTGAGRVTFNPFSITRKIDKSSP